MSEVTKKRIGILRGGSGEHYHFSLKKGGDFIAHVLENLSEKYTPVDILVDKDYLWHVNGLPIRAGDLMHKVDVVWNFSHPSFSNILESLSIPHISESSFLSTFQNNRQMFRDHVKNIGLEIPRSIILPVYQKDFDGPREKYSIKKAKEVFEKFGSPWIVKPAWSELRGRSVAPELNMAVHLAKTFPELVRSIEDGLDHNVSMLVEELIPGKIASIHSVSHFRNQEFYTFPFGSMFGNFSSAEKDKLISLARDLYRHIGAKHYLKMDFVLHPRGRVYLLNIESHPNLKENSHFHEACKSASVKMHEVLDHILGRAFSH